MLIITGFVTYSFAIRHKKYDKQIEIDSALIQRRMALYERIEDIVIQLRKMDIVPRDWTKCELVKRKQHTVLNMPFILYIMPIYNDLSRLKEFDNAVKTIETESILLSKDMNLWLYLISSLNENCISAYEKISTPKYFQTEIEDALGDVDEKIANLIFLRYMNIAILYDMLLFGGNIEKSVQNFYASKNKMKFKRQSFIHSLINILLSKHFLQNSNCKKIFTKKGEKNKARKIMLTCLHCNEDCVYAGKNILQSVKEQNTEVINET